MKILYVCNKGGHYSQMLRLRDVMRKFDSVLLTDSKGAEVDMADCAKVINITPYNVSRFRVIWLVINLFQCLCIWLRYRPAYIVTTGAGLAVPMFVVGKLCGSHLIFIESRSRVYTKTKTGKLLGRYCDKVIVQWPEMVDVYDGKAEYYGTLV